MRGLHNNTGAMPRRPCCCCGRKLPRNTLLKRPTFDYDRGEVITVYFCANRHDCAAHGGKR